VFILFNNKELAKQINIYIQYKNILKQVFTYIFSSRSWCTWQTNVTWRTLNQYKIIIILNYNLEILY